MKRKLNLFFATSLLISSGLSILGLITNTNDINSENLIPNNDSSDIDIKTATKYANETSIIPKSLLIGQNKGFSTNKLLNNMYDEQQTPDIKNFIGNNTGNDFINNWTENLDGNSINNIQSLYQRNGINQAAVDETDKKINDYETYAKYLPDIKDYFNNTNLSNQDTVQIVDDILKDIKSFFSNIDIDDYLTYTKYIPLATGIVKELLTDWDQQKDFTGNTPLAQMKDYMSKKGTFSQAWNNTDNNHPQWYYVEEQAKANSWNWNQFYEYMAGVNFNYMIKKVSGKYIGEMLDDHIHLGGGLKFVFDSDLFNDDIAAALNKIFVTPDIWPNLIKVLVPIIKTKLINLDNPTLGIKNITWDNDLHDNKSIQLKQILIILHHLLSPDGKTDLTKIIVQLLTGPFGEDVIVNLGWIIGDYTLPNLFSSFSSSRVKIDEISSNLYDTIIDKIKGVSINDIIQKILDFTNKYLTINPIIDLKDLSTYLDLIFNRKEFNMALEYIKDMIDHPQDAKHSAKEILALLGVQFQGEKTFKPGSIFASLSNWLNTSNSSLNQLLSIFIGDKIHPGIIDNMIKKQKDLYQDMYVKYFDMDNSTYFTLSNIKMNKYQHDDGSVSVILSYKIKSKLDNRTYDVTFKNDDFTSKDFKLTLLHGSSLEL